MSLLRKLAGRDESAFRKDPHKALLDAALLVRRAGLEHLVTEAEPAEVLAMATAGERIAQERAALLFADPASALEPIDGGAAKREALLEEAFAIAARRAAKKARR